MTAEPAGSRPQRPTAASARPDVLALQRSIGNRATTRLIQRDPPGPTAPGAEYTATISGEAVVVKSKSEEDRAKEIIDKAKNRYGVEVNSLKGATATKDHYANAPATERDKVAAMPWHFRELVAVGKALDHFAPILGKARARSTRSSDDQEITTLGKETTSITTNTATGVADPNTLGEFYRSSKTFAIYKSSETSTVDFPGDVDKQIEATTTHEISHGLMYYMITSFMAASDFWLDENTKSGKASAEVPPTNYGKTNAREDLCESVMLYFVDPQRLKSNAPKRYEAIRAAVDGWVLPENQPGDFPLPDPNAAVAVA